MTILITDPKQVTFEIPWVLGEIVIEGPAFDMQIAQTQAFVEKIMEWEGDQHAHFVFEIEEGAQLMIKNKHVPALQSKVQAILEEHAELDEGLGEWGEEDEDDLITAFTAFE